MTTAELLAELSARGVIVSQSGDRLLIDAPKGELTPELKEQLRQAKTALLAALADPEEDATADPASRTWMPEAVSAPGETGTPALGDDRAPAEQAKPSTPWRGIVTAWGRERGWLAVRDPNTGEWHDLPAREAPPSWIPKKRI